MKQTKLAKRALLPCSGRDAEPACVGLEDYPSWTTVGRVGIAVLQRC